MPAAEYNPFEYIKTNVIGAQNLITASINQGVKSYCTINLIKPVHQLIFMVLLSFVQINYLYPQTIYLENGTIFSVVRYGNVFASRGSAIPYFIDLNKKINQLQLQIKK